MSFRSDCTAARSWGAWQPPSIPVIFLDDPPANDQRVAVIAALNAVDEHHDRERDDWMQRLAVTRG